MWARDRGWTPAGRAAFGQVDILVNVAGVSSHGSAETVTEAEAAKDGLNEKELLAAINNKLKANARAKSMTEALKNAGYEKPEADNPQVILKSMIKNLVLAKKSPAEAQELAETLLGYKLES